MNVFVLNVGSSSVKYSVFRHDTNIITGEIERIGLRGTIHSYSIDGHDKKKRIKADNFEAAIREIFKEIESLSIKVDAIGHRFVHGGNISESQIINKRLISRLRPFSRLAPLHNPPELEAIETCHRLFRHIPQVAVFDTAFHQGIPDYAYTYAIPYRLAKKHRIRRYGFHGTSHHFVALEAAKTLKKRITKLKLITCHLGNGCSVCAVKHGRSVDTSMGLTPLEGLVMGTRCGDIDPAIIFFLMQHENLCFTRINDLLNKKSGLLGVSGISSDFKDLLRARKDNERARLAIEMFVYRLVKYIGAYNAAMDGVDAIVFTGGIGERSAYLRSKVAESLSYLGVKINKTANRRHKTIVSKANSKVEILCLETNEELMIARETEKAVSLRV